LLHILKVVGTYYLSRISAYGPLELPSTLGIRPHLGAEGPESTRESRNPQPLRLRFRARLTEEGAREVELIRARGDSYVADT
jgi:hypothetical protein